MKKYLIVILLIIPIITTCTNSKQSETIKTKFMMIKANSDNKVIINKNQIIINKSYIEKYKTKFINWKEKIK